MRLALAGLVRMDCRNVKTGKEIFTIKDAVKKITNEKGNPI